MARKKAKISNLKKHAHKGRRAHTGDPRTRRVVNDPAGVRATGLRGDARFIAAALGRISPTPHGPESHWPGG